MQVMHTRFWPLELVLEKMPDIRRRMLDEVDLSDADMLAMEDVRLSLHCLLADLGGWMKETEDMEAASDVLSLGSSKGDMVLG